jgi:hypothetical protein
MMGAGLWRQSLLPKRRRFSMEGSAITYVYKCKNRKCKLFKKEVQLPSGPTAHVAEKKQLPTCAECSTPLKFVSMKYLKEVFGNPAGKIDLSMSESELTDIIKAAEQTVQDREKKKGSSS